MASCAIVVLLSGLVTGCMTAEGPAPQTDRPSTTDSPEAEAETPSPARTSELASAPPSTALDGPCHELSQGRVRFDTADAQRVVFATAEERQSTEVVLTGCVQTEDGYSEEWTAPGFIGEGGFGPVDSTEVNTLQTPTGSYSVTEGFGREDPGTALEYHTLTPDSRWGGREGPYFNEYFEGSGEWPDEDLWELMDDGLYEQAVVVNFNRPPDAVAQLGLSFAIFLHAGLTESWGCVSTDLETVTRVLRDATPGDRIVMGAVGDVFRDQDIEATHTETAPPASGRTPR